MTSNKVKDSPKTWLGFLKGVCNVKKNKISFQNRVINYKAAFILYEQKVTIISIIQYLSKFPKNNVIYFQIYCLKSSVKLCNLHKYIYER